MTTTDPGGQSGGAGQEPTTDGGTDTGTGTGSIPGQTFTQEQVNRLLAAERRTVETRFADYDTLKGRVGELEAAGQSELEKATTKAQAAEAERDGAVRQRDQLLIRSAIIAEAARAQVIDPDVAVALLAEKFKVTSKGEIDGDVAREVKSLLEERPFLAANGKPMSGAGSADAGAHGSRPATGAAKNPAQQMDDVLRGNR